jgi:hypothetical protein
MAAGLGVAVVMSLGAQATAVMPSGPAAAKPSAPDTPDVSAVRAALEKRGFEVAQGDFHLWGREGCPESFELMETCFFNNPTSPYDWVILPPWPEEHTDPATEGAVGLSTNVPGPTGQGSGAIFRFDPNEAILIFGELPPEAAFFSLQSYLFSRVGDYSTDNDTYDFLAGLGATGIFFHEIPGSPERIASWNSITNSTNNVMIERQSGVGWEQDRYFVISPDRYMDKQVRQVLHRLSVDRDDIFSEAIPSNLTFGLGEQADEFISFIRYARPDDGGAPGTASWEWMQDPPLQVLRIRDTRTRPQQSYPAWGVDSPEVRTAVPEAYLEDALDDLANEVSTTWGQPCTGGDCIASGQGARFVDTQSAPFNLVGPKCSLIGMDCLGDAQDASYQFRPGQSYDDGEVYAVVGALGTATGNATYVSLGVNNTQLRLGALNVDGSELVGSALPYGVDHADELFVHFFTRDCSGLEDLTGGSCTEVGDGELEIPPGAPASFVERDYVAVGTQRGPDSSLLLPSIAITLQRPIG